VRLKFLIFSVLLFAFCVPVFAQNHTSVSLENQVYYILEQAELKGFCSRLSGTKPYTRSVVIAAIYEILDSDNEKIKDTERDVLQYYLDQFEPQKGLIRVGTTIGKEDDLPLTLNAGINGQLEGSAGYHSSLDDVFFGGEVWLRVFLNGDIGNNVSWEFAGEGGLMAAPRHLIGEKAYNTYYEGFYKEPPDGKPYSEFQNQKIDIYSEPLTHFPYTYKKRWDGSVFFFSNLDTFAYWPETVAGAYNLLSELTASFLDDKLIIRLGRLPSREWGSTSLGSSLSLNQMARPFLGIEAEFRPFSWFGYSSMTGFLEYFNTEDIKKSASSFQNAYSIALLQFNYKSYLFLDVGEAVIWPKRLELGYISPITNSIFYQNNIGDFDNMSMILNIKAQYPGLGNLWFSLFWDEAYWVPDAYELDRTMLVLQGGATISLPFLSFSSLKLSYTKVNPYSYTHNRNFNPWYGDTPMETSYTNNGVSLGYYLPPNSDEILVRFKTMPAKNIIANLQYQMIRHGADFGSSAVDGSNILSELDPDGRDSNIILKRYFLRDGAYQWMHIIKLGGEWSLSKAPLAFYAEAGTVISYFTNIEGPANNGRADSYSIIDTTEYPKSTNFIARLGVKIFPR
jgi:hypothetical protein